MLAKRLLLKIRVTLLSEKMRKVHYGDIRLLTEGIHGHMCIFSMAKICSLCSKLFVFNCKLAWQLVKKSFLNDSLIVNYDIST